MRSERKLRQAKNLTGERANRSGRDKSRTSGRTTQKLVRAPSDTGPADALLESFKRRYQAILPKLRELTEAAEAGTLDPADMVEQASALIVERMRALKRNAVRTHRTRL